ncbi:MULTISPECIES: glycoside hydrolase family 31 protein [Paraburkholderia]|uniref:Glycoside hydrolase family 31 protein n=1 Tax=Paraburkholderia podalyriae TaxID=1938811 RepID=A0ABR7PHR5_9BURK|nr:glycoside hydrolase family 31 protein [Paraburkholderia podalyriae]MBC8745906.1 glycoside hydrolase family 31 protein [Paraburkholderia podalyriae]
MPSLINLKHPPRFALVPTAGNPVVLTAQPNCRIELFVLAEDIIRVLVLPDGATRGPRTWAIAPGADDVPLEGRERHDLSGFTPPPFTVNEEAGHVVIETARVRVSVALDGGACAWDILHEGTWHRVMSDRKTQAYNFGWWDSRVYHYVERRRDEMYVGLGERAGSLDRAQQSYEMRNIDAMGYSARTTDPLYKHIPFYVTWQPQTSTGFGLFYDTLADCRFDMGRELDNYHGHYRHFIAEHGDLDYYFIASPGSPLDAVRRFTWLTGRPAWMPKWGLGYSGSTMSYTDAPNAQKQMGEFIERCREHDVLCDSFHLSSGYTSIGPKRYVFNWNRDKFPDIDGFVQSYLDYGVRLCANIKPCLLQDHPAFDDVAQAGLLIEAPDGEPAWVQFWDEVGAYLDFTNPATIDWWKARVKDALLKYGIAATWNDNNEFEIWSPHSIARGFGKPYPALEAKVLQTQLMMRASRDAQREHAPDKRPFLVSRSGGVGMHRYVQTWSGDNYTSWETLRFNLKMGLGLAMSGVSNCGHDIGGFAGPAPEPELFARWVAFGIFLPRFSIHSWNDDGTVNEPWMHPEVTRHVADLIKLRYRLIPYLYELLWQSHSAYEPVLRPLFAEFPHDPRCLVDGDDMMLGSSMLVAPVVDPGQSTRDVYLPAGSRWVSYWSGEAFDGGQSVTLPAPFERPVFLLREGGVIALNIAEQHFGRPADERAFLAVPYAGAGTAHGGSIVDDGETEAWRDGEQGRWNVTLTGDANTLRVTLERPQWMPRAQPQVRVFVPMHETRAIVCTNGTLAADHIADGWRCLTISLPH